MFRALVKGAFGTRRKTLRNAWRTIAPMEVASFMLGPRNTSYRPGESQLGAALFAILKATIGLRVSAEEEIEGLDVLEHGLQGYAADMGHT